MGVLARPAAAASIHVGGMWSECEQQIRRSTGVQEVRRSCGF
jgi:hypothetical protein